MIIETDRFRIDRFDVGETAVMVVDRKDDCEEPKTFVIEQSCGEINYRLGADDLQLISMEPEIRPPSIYQIWEAVNDDASPEEIDLIELDW